MDFIVYANEMIYRFSHITIEKFIINIFWWVGFAYSQALKIALEIHSVYFKAMKHLNMKSHAIKWLIPKNPIRFFLLFHFLLSWTNYLLYFYLQLPVRAFRAAQTERLYPSATWRWLRKLLSLNKRVFFFFRSLSLRHETHKTPHHPPMLLATVTSPYKWELLSEAKNKM